MEQPCRSTDPEASSTGSPYRLQSLDRAVSVLEMLGSSQAPLSLGEVCQRMQLHKSTAHRALMVLERCRLIERTHDNRYRLGLRLYELGHRAVEQVDLRTRIRPFLRRLSSQIGETVHLGVLQKSSVVYLEKAEPYRRVCAGSRTGTSNPVYCTSLGKAMLAYLPAAAADEIISSLQFVRYTEKTIATREELLSSLERVRRRNYAIDDEEIEMGTRCVGAPVFGENHMPIAALSLSGPTGRIRAPNVPALAAQLVRCCAEISDYLHSERPRRTAGLLH